MSVPSAPSRDGVIVAVPSLTQADSLIEQNRRALRVGPDFLGKSLVQLRNEARRGAIRAAQEYFAENDEPVPHVNSDTLVIAGHQPELFHPGVWLKNFALNRIAGNTNATPLALIVDNDTVKSTVIHLPSLRSDGAFWYRAQIPFDYHGADAPYEERSVSDDRIFESFPERMAAVSSGWRFEPICAEFWRDVLIRRNRTPLVGECFAAARRSFERRIGCHNLEVPLSRLCAGESFARFACHLLTNLAKFQSTYNAIVRDYRKAHGIRSRNHPVPDLASDGDWLEAPFWIWRSGDNRRRRLFVRSRNGVFEMRGIGAASSPAQWHEDLAARGMKVRPRALTTTLYARLLLADLFVHGIGGAKYDELTDQLLRRFYKMEPPAFMIVSGTLLLPLADGNVDPDRCLALSHEFRDLWCNPQRHLDSTDTTANRLANEKMHWINRGCTTAQERKERCLRLRELTARLREFVMARRKETERQLTACRAQLASQSVLVRRDYPFCLFPEDKLRRFFQQIAE